MAQFGRALRSGRRGRVFESRRFDEKKSTGKSRLKASGAFILFIDFFEVYLVVIYFTVFRNNEIF